MTDDNRLAEIRAWIARDSYRPATDEELTRYLAEFDDEYGSGLTPIARANRPSFERHASPEAIQVRLDEANRKRRAWCQRFDRRIAWLEGLLERRATEPWPPAEPRTTDLKGP